MINYIISAFVEYQIVTGYLDLHDINILAHK